MARKEIAAEKKSVSLSSSHTPAVIEMLDRIMQAEGYMSRSAALDQCIRAMHGKIFPAYSGLRPANVKPTEDEKAGVIADKTEREQVRICSALGGSVVDGAGGKVCHYKTFHFAKEYEQKIPFGRLSEALLDNQYTPSKVAVEKARKDAGI